MHHRLAKFLTGDFGRVVRPITCSLTQQVLHAFFQTAYPSTSLRSMLFVTMLPLPTATITYSPKPTQTPVQDIAPLPPRNTQRHNLRLQIVQKPNLQLHQSQVLDTLLRAVGLYLYA